MPGRLIEHGRAGGRGAPGRPWLLTGRGALVPSPGCGLTRPPHAGAGAHVLGRDVVVHQDLLLLVGGIGRGGGGGAGRIEGGGGRGRGVGGGARLGRF